MAAAVATESKKVDRRPWYHPLTLAGAWTKAKRSKENPDNAAPDALLREFTRLLVQTGAVGVAALLCGLLYVGMTRVSTSMDGMAAALTKQARALDDHLDEDLKNELADLVVQRLQPKPPEPKPVVVKPIPARSRP